MTDIDILQRLFEDIKIKNHYPDFDEWSNSVYSELSESIHEKTGVLLSRNTLKNILSKIKEHDTKYTPQSSTRNALSRYIGSENWKSYRSQFVQNETHFKEIKDKFPFSISFKKVAIATFTAGLIVVGVLLLGNRNNNVHKTYEFTAGFSDTVGHAPHTISINYDFSKLKTDSASLDLGTYSLSGKYEQKKYQNKTGVENFCFHHPGYYHTAFYINKEIVQEQNVLIKSNGWIASVYDARTTNSAIPKFILINKTRIPNYIPLDNYFIEDITKDGMLFISEEKAFAIDVIPKNYKTRFENYSDFNISGDNFSFSSSFHNPDFGKETYCYSVEFTLIGSKGFHRFRIMQPGCKLFARYTFGDIEKDGIKQTINNFEHAFKEPGEINLNVIDKNVVLKFNNSEIFTGSYTQNIGNIIGVKIDLKGASAVDWIELKDNKTTEIFRDDF